MTYDKLMTNLGNTYEKLMKFITFFVNRAHGELSTFATVVQLSVV